MKASSRVVERALEQSLKDREKPKCKKDFKTFASQTWFEDLALNFIVDYQS